MPRFLFTYHGGSTPSNPDEVEAVRAAWGQWMTGMSDKLVDAGGPSGPSRTVTSAGVDEEGGSNPVSGYSLVQADTIEDAIRLAQGCPILTEGSVEVTEILEI